jgi:NAD(P)-dependent dehydrogenase (short-subunit alcohol dehydrogenase family)
MSKRIAVIGGTGTIGSAVVENLKSAGHDVVAVGHSSGDFQVDISDSESIANFYGDLGEVDAIVCAAGNAEFGELGDLSEEQFHVGLNSKLMGQVNLVRMGRDHVAADGSFTLVSGVLAENPIPGSAAISPVNAGVEGFTRAAALELDQRVNCVSPGWVSETLEAMGRDPEQGTPAASVAEVFAAAVDGDASGEVLPAVG